jgi:hypothetical protein
MKLATSCTRVPRAASAATSGAISLAGVEMSKSRRTTLGRRRDPSLASHPAAGPELRPTVKALRERFAGDALPDSPCPVALPQPEASATAVSASASRLAIRSITPNRRP